MNFPLFFQHFRMTENLQRKTLVLPFSLASWPSWNAWRRLKSAANLELKDKAVRRKTIWGITA